MEDLIRGTGNAADGTVYQTLVSERAKGWSGDSLSVSGKMH